MSLRFPQVSFFARLEAPLRSTSRSASGFSCVQFFWRCSSGSPNDRHEIVLLGTSAPDHRLALADYSPQLLDQLITIAASATIVSYALYTAEPTTVENFGTDRLTWTLPFPIYGVFRYLYLVHRHKGGGSPSEMLLRDRPLLACVALWAMAIVLIIYRS